MSLLALLVAVAVGLAVATQASILGGVSRSLHPLAISFSLQVAGVLAGLLWIIWSRTWSQALDVATAWWWLPLGVVGLGVVAALGFSSARLGTLLTLAVVVAAQLGGGLVLDLWRGELVLDWRQPLGIVFVLAGVVLVSARP